jgi:thiamine biosynthesis lipoprotein
LLTAEIDSTLRAFDLSLNPFNSSSIISRVNRNEDVEVDDRFMVVFNRAQEVSAETGGLFDATTGPLISAWGFGPNRMLDPSPAIIDSLLEFVGYKKVSLEGRRVIKSDPRIQLNYSAIAKGYACDVIAELLHSHGIDNYMIDIGGELRVSGLNAEGICWRAGISRPAENADATDVPLSKILSSCESYGMATSGNYRNYHMRDGVRYGHTIDPLSGYPAHHTLLSATVIAADCMSADAYATSFMVMGADSAISFAAHHPELRYYLIIATPDSTYTTLSSPGL